MSASRPLRVGISALVTPPRLTGVGNYLKGLLSGLDGLASEVEYVLFTTSELECHFLPRGPRFEICRLPLRHGPRSLMLPATLAWLHIALAGQARRRGLDLVHLPNLVALARKPYRATVVTLFDLTELRVPGKYPPLRTAYRRFAARRVTRLADHVLTGSETARGDLVRHLDLAPERVTVTPLGAADRDPPPPGGERDRVLERLGVEKPYLLYVGKALPHKNLDRLLAAFARAVETRGETGAPLLRLVLTGCGDAADRLAATARELGIGDRTRVLPWIDDADLGVLYAEARAAVLVSLWEGFGLPVAEALAAGLPVVVSDRAGLPEVAGAAGVVVDPESVTSIARGLARVAFDASLRRRLAEHAPHEARRHSWLRCAERTEAVYRQVAGR